MKSFFCIPILYLIALQSYGVESKELSALMGRSQAFDRGVPLTATVEAEIVHPKNESEVMKYKMYTTRTDKKILVMIDFFYPDTYDGTRILTTVPEEGGVPSVSVKLKLFFTSVDIPNVKPDMSFFGMDFDSGDMNPRNPLFDIYSILSTEKFPDGNTCYVVEALPVDDSPYYKTIHYVDADRELIMKSEMYDKKNKLVKIFEVMEVEKIQGIWTVTEAKMTNVKTNSCTTLVYSNIAYGEDNSPYVTKKFLKNGELK